MTIKKDVMSSLTATQAILTISFPDSFPEIYPCLYSILCNKAHENLDFVRQFTLP